MHESVPQLKHGRYFHDQLSRADHRCVFEQRFNLGYMNACRWVVSMLRRAALAAG